VIKKILLSVVLLILLPTANAGNLQAIISGKTFHTSGDNLNENNIGLGLQYEFAAKNRWIPLVNFASFEDSNNQNSKYVGAGIKRRFKISYNPFPIYFDAGALGLAMTRQDYNDNQPFLGAIPFVSISNNWAGINATYVPKIDKDMVPFWYIQFSLKLLEI
jgi:hypothetical protein